MKYSISIPFFDLAVPSNRIVVRLAADALSVRIAGVKASGTWATYAPTVKWAGSGSTFDFSTARTIAAGGGNVYLNQGDLEGVREIEIKLPGTESGVASIEIEIEQKDGPAPVAFGVSGQLAVIRVGSGQ